MAQHIEQYYSITGSYTVNPLREAWIAFLNPYIEAQGPRMSLLEIAQTSYLRGTRPVLTGENYIKRSIDIDSKMMSKM